MGCSASIDLCASTCACPCFAKAPSPPQEPLSAEDEADLALQEKHGVRIAPLPDYAFEEATMDVDIVLSCTSLLETVSETDGCGKVYVIGSRGRVGLAADEFTVLPDSKVKGSTLSVALGPREGDGNLYIVEE
jgi:hypothetical protein